MQVRFGSALLIAAAVAAVPACVIVEDGNGDDAEGEDVAEGEDDDDAEGEDGEGEAPDPCEGLTLDPVLGTLTLGAGFEVQFSKELPAGNFVFAQDSDGELYALDVLTGAVTSFGVLADDENDLPAPVALFSALPAVDAETSFASPFLLANGTENLIAGHTGAGLAGSLVFADLEGETPNLELLSANGNFSADLVDDALLVNGLSLNTTPNALGLYRYDIDDDSEGTLVATRAGAVGSGATAITDTNVVVTGFFEAGSNHIYVLPAPTVLGADEPIALDATDELVDGGVAAATSFEDGVAVTRVDESFTATSIVHFPLSLDELGEDFAVNKGAEANVLVAPNACTQIGAASTSKASGALLVSVQDPSGQRLLVIQSVAVDPT